MRSHNNKLGNYNGVICLLSKAESNFTYRALFLDIGLQVFYMPSIFFNGGCKYHKNNCHKKTTIFIYISLTWKNKGIVYKVNMILCLGNNYFFWFLMCKQSDLHQRNLFLNRRYIFRNPHPKDLWRSLSKMDKTLKIYLPNVIYYDQSLN